MHPLRSSVVVALASVVGSLIPLLPFVLLAPGRAVPLTVAISGLALFGVGAYQAKSLVGDWRRSGLRLAAIGLGAAFLGYLVGRLFNVSG